MEPTENTNNLPDSNEPPSLGEPSNPAISSGQTEEGSIPLPAPAQVFRPTESPATPTISPPPIVPVVNPEQPPQPLSVPLTPEQPITTSAKPLAGSVVVGDGLQPGGPTTPAIGPLPPNSMTTASPAVPESPTTPKRLRLMLISLAIVIVVLIGGGVAYYFLYFMNPNVIWSDSLSNMDKGYTSLINYVTKQPTQQYNGVSGNGSFTVNDSSMNYNGSFDVNISGENSTSSLKLDLGVANINAQVRTIAVAGSSEPDVYLNISGIQNYLNDFSTEYPSLSSLNGKWIYIDHNLLDDIKREDIKKAASSGLHNLTRSEVISFLQAVGNVNKKYLFTANPKYAVTKVVSKDGFQTINGIKTYRYKVGFNDNNLKSYIENVCSTLKQSQVGTYITEENGISSLANSCSNLESSALKIKSSSTVEVWADTSNRLIYQIRVNGHPDPAENYIDVGLNYATKDPGSLPFFMSGQYNKEDGNTGTFNIGATFNTDTNKVNLSLVVKGSGSSPYEVSGNMNSVPTNTKLNVTAPAGAESIITVLDNLGLGQYIDQLQSNSSSNNTNSTNITALAPGLAPIADVLETKLATPDSKSSTSALASLENLHL